MRACRVLTRLLDSAMRRRLLCSQQQADAAAVTKSVELKTGFFGLLTVAAPGRNVEIASLDPAEYDDVGQVLATLGDSAGGGIRARQLGVREWQLEAAETAVGDKRALKVMVPPPMDLSVTCGAACSLSVLENRSIELTASPPQRSGESAQFRLDRVKSGKVRATSNSGPVSLQLSRTLLQTLAVQAPDGVALRASMYQGAEVNLDSPAGTVAMETQATYCRSCSLRGARLNFSCASAHGDFQLDASESGEVAVSSLEGSLRLRMLEAQVRFHLTRPGQVTLDVAEGSVELGLQREPQGVSGARPLLLDVTASGVDIEDAELVELAGQDAVFPMGAGTVRLLVELPGCGGPRTAGEEGAEAASECRVRLLSGRVRLRLRSEGDSGLFGAGPLS